MYQFTEDCLIGIEEIDNEHRKLFTLINEAAELPKEARTPKTVNRSLVTRAPIKPNASQWPNSWTAAAPSTVSSNPQPLA